MIAPLSAKQEREWAKHHAKESRESKKMEHEENRKQQLHEIKLQEAAVKAGQGVAHKEELHGIKVKELGGPLSGKRVNRQKLGLPSNNPLAGSEVFNRGQHMLPKGTDTVPAMLTPGEAVIPRAAAQDPKNKPLIKQMVQQGRQVQHHAQGTTGIVQKQNMIPILPKVAAHRKVKGYADGTEAVPNMTNYYHTDSAASMSDGTTEVQPQYYIDGVEEVPPVVVQPEVAQQEPVQPIVQQEVVQPEVPQPVVQQEAVQPVVQAEVPVQPVEQPKPVPVAEVSAVPTVEDKAVVPAPVVEAAVTTPPKPVAPVNERTKPEYWVKHLQGVQADLDKAAASSKDQQGFVDSFKDIFSYKGLKDALGLNNQEVARMAVTYLGGRARGYNGAQSLSYAGRSAFDSSLQRQNREASEKGANMRLGVQMAAQERTSERLDNETKRKELAAEKKEYAALAAAKRKELENDQDRYENFAAKDVPPSVRQKAVDIAYAPLKGSTPEERLEERRQNMRQATTLLANSVVYKDPNSGRHDRVAKWGYYEDAKGNTVYAAQDPYGSGDMIVRHPNGKTEKMGGQLLRPEGTTAKQGELVAKVTKNYLEGTKGADGKPIDTSAVGAKIMTVMQDFPGIGDNPFAVNAAIEPTVKALAESGKDYSATAVRAAFTGNMVKTLMPTQTDLFVAQGSKPGAVKPVSGSSLVEFGKAMQDAQSANRVDLSKATETYVDVWNKLPVNDKQKIANTTRDGYSPFQEFVIRDVKKQK